MSSQSEKQYFKEFSKKLLDQERHRLMVLARMEFENCCREMLEYGLTNAERNQRAMDGTTGRAINSITHGMPRKHVTPRYLRELVNCSVPDKLIDRTMRAFNRWHSLEGVDTHDKLLNPDWKWDRIGSDLVKLLDNDGKPGPCPCGPIDTRSLFPKSEPGSGIFPNLPSEEPEPEEEVREREEELALLLIQLATAVEDGRVTIGELSVSTGPGDRVSILMEMSGRNNDLKDFLDAVYNAKSSGV